MTKGTGYKVERHINYNPHGITICYQVVHKSRNKIDLWGYICNTKAEAERIAKRLNSKPI